MSFSIDIRKARGPQPRVSFARIAREILGPSYSLSLVMCEDTLAQKMNRLYRKKTYKPNVLSFPLSKTEGEIFLNLRKAAREAIEEGVSFNERVAFLFIHACLHLKGLDHSDRMDALEDTYMRKYFKPTSK